jgi:flagellin
MTLSINTNIAATRASKYLAANHQNLQKSLDRLSSGKRITSSSDDAGGLAVSMKLEHSINGLEGASKNISNAISLLQVQDGILDSAGQIITRMGELKSMHSDVTKSNTDQDAYNGEYQDLVNQLNSMKNSKFNGIRIFASIVADNTLTVDVNGTNIGITQQGFEKEINSVVTSSLVMTATTTMSLGDNTAANFTSALERIADMRAANGGQVKRLEYALADVSTQITNLTAANGRIMDVDIAEESAALAKHQILVQASASMVAQANSANNVALQLLQ